MNLRAYEWVKISKVVLLSNRPFQEDVHLYFYAPHNGSIKWPLCPSFLSSVHHFFRLSFRRTKKVRSKSSTPVDLLISNRNLDWYQWGGVQSLRVITLTFLVVKLVPFVYFHRLVCLRIVSRKAFQNLTFKF